MRKRKVIVEFEFADKFDVEEFEASLDGWVGDFMDTELANDLDYTIFQKAD